MANEEDYDIVPHKEVLELKKQVDEIKQNPFGATKEGHEMLEVMRKLSESMDHLTGLFQEAAEQMKLEERESELMAKKLDPLFGKMDDLIEQNKKIARGIIAVADMVKDDISKPKAAQQGNQFSMPEDEPSAEIPVPELNTKPMPAMGRFPPAPGPQPQFGARPSGMQPPPGMPPMSGAAPRNKKRLFPF